MHHAIRKLSHGTAFVTDISVMLWTGGSLTVTLAQDREE